MKPRAESAFSSYEGEVSAVVYVVQRFRYYMLWGKPFKLIIDCKAMQWLTSQAKEQDTSSVVSNLGRV